MSAFYHEGERKRRPGVYLRIINRGEASGATALFQVTPTPTQPMPPPTLPDEVDGIMVAYDGIGLVTLAIPGCTVTHDGNGTVTLSGLTVPVTHDDAGNVTIGG